MPPKGKTITELRRELQAKESKLVKLHSARRKVEKRLQKIDKKIAALAGGAAQPGARKTRKTKARKRATGKPLVDYIAGVLGKAKTAMRVKDVMFAVVKAGYKTHSKDFYTIVATALRDPKKFARVARGTYKLKA